MSKSARSVFVGGLYRLLLGTILLIAPNFLLGLFFLSSTTEVWIRVVGMLLIYIGYYYVQAAREEMTGFFRWTVHVNSTVIILLTGFVLLNFVRPPVVLFGVVDLLNALWTSLTLRSLKTV